jgi:hypothetical protein
LIAIGARANPAVDTNFLRRLPRQRISIGVADSVNMTNIASHTNRQSFVV